MSDIAPMVITARSAYGSSCRALCFLPENMHGILNVLLIQLIAAFQKVQRATQHSLFSNGDGYPPTIIRLLPEESKILALEPEQT